MTFEEERQQIQECVSQGYQECLSIYGVCAIRQSDCSTDCDRTYDCYTQCCYNYKCVDNSRCQGNNDLDNGSSHVDPTIILAILFPSLVFIFLVVFCICFQRARRDARLRKIRDERAQMQNNNAQNQNLNQQMMIQNNMAMQMQQNQYNGNYYQNQIPQGIIYEATLYPTPGVYSNQGQGVVLQSQQQQQQQHNNGLVSYI